MTNVYLGLGSNLSKPEQQLKSAIRALHHLPATSFLKCSSLYASQPMGPKDQPDYVNAVVLLETDLEPSDLLAATQKIELEQGRERKENRWGPRTLDIDILLFGQRIIDTPDLIVPHYGMQDREFVLYPLYEIAADLVLPKGEILSELVKTCPLNGLQAIQNSTTF